MNPFGSHIGFWGLPNHYGLFSRMKIKYLIILLFLLLRALFAQESEYRVKAALVEKITRFVEWPFEKSSEDTNSFNIGVLGNSPILPFLEELSHKKTIKNRTVKIIHFTHYPAKESVNVLFISKDMRKKLKIILAHTKNKDILTIGDSPGFAKKGVMVNFYEWKGFIRFEISKKAIENSRLNFSSRLLRLARIVE